MPGPAPRRLLPDAFPEIYAQLVAVPGREGLDPASLGTGSDIAVRWRCPGCGNEWVAPPSARTAGRGCPTCAQVQRARSRAQAPTGRALADLRPEVAAEFAENLTRPDMGPTELRVGSQQRCRWRCRRCAAEFESTVANRASGKGCPACANAARTAARRRIRPGTQTAADLATFPPTELVENLTTPGSGLHELTPASADRCRWQCSTCSHRWEATVVNRVTKGSACPRCAPALAGAARRDPRPGGSLADLHPELAAELVDLADGSGRGASEVRPGSNALATWQCRRGHQWVTTIASRVSGTGCARCVARGQSRLEFEVAELLAAATGRRVTLDRPVTAGGRRWRIDLHIPDLALLIDLDPAHWHRNAARDQRKADAITGVATGGEQAGPAYVRVRTRTAPCLTGVRIVVVDDTTIDPVAWAAALRPAIEDAGGSWRVLTAADTAQAMSAAAARWQRTLRGRPIRSALDSRPELAAQLIENRSRLGVGLEWLTPSSSDQCTWSCPDCGHQWQASVGSRAGLRTDCPLCARAATAARVRRASIPVPDQSLAALHPDISASFVRCLPQPDRTPHLLAPFSNLRCEWRCPGCAATFLASPASRVRRPDSGCRQCGSIKGGMARSHAAPGGSLADRHPDLAAEFVHIPARPGWTATDVLPGSNLQARWRCRVCGCQWTTPVATRAGGAGCPACARAVVVAARRRPPAGRSLADLHPGITGRFVENLTHPGSGPAQLRPASHDNCRWQCPACQHRYLRTVKNAVRQGGHCPACRT